MNTSPEKTPDTRRAHYLDALRGLAALLVVITHYLAATYPYSVFANASRHPQQHLWEQWLLIPPLSLLSAAHFAVCLFFVLSGYVLSLSLIGKGANGRRVLGAMIKRPFRLGGLTLFSLLAGALLWNIDWLYNLDAATLSGSQEWLGSFWRGQFNLSEFIRALFSGRAGAEYNPPLWTLKIELIGSFLVFLSLLFINHFGYWIRSACLMTLLFVLHDQYYAGFVIGMLFADAHSQLQSGSKKQEYGIPESGNRTRFSNRQRSAGIRILGITALLLASYPYYASEALWQSLQVRGWPNLSALGSQISMLAATLVFLFVLLSPGAQALLNRRALTWLGEISFALYVLHFLLLGSFTSWALLQLTPITGYDNAVLLGTTASMLLLFPLASLATRWVDRPSIALGQLAERQVFRWTAVLAPSASLPRWFQRR